MIYLVTTAQKVAENGVPFVFSDGHGIASFTDWYCDLADLNKIDWEVIQSRYWADTLEDGDRKRRRQAEFLIHRFCPWSLILGIAVLNDKMKKQVEAILARFPGEKRIQVVVKTDWYY